MKTRRLGFLGAGNMAAALIKGLLHGEVLPPARILASDVKAERLEQLHAAHGIRTTMDNHQLLRESFLCPLLLWQPSAFCRTPEQAVPERARTAAPGAGLLLLFFLWSWLLPPR